MATDAQANTHHCVDALLQRVLIVDAHPPTVKMLSDLLRSIARCQIWTAADWSRAMDLARTSEPYLVFVEHGGGQDGIGFTRKLRHSYVAARKAAVIVVSAEATAAAIIGARDAGAHEFLRRPFTFNDLLRRLETVARRPRVWIEGIDYVGPDRRRFNAGNYAGPLRRRIDHAATPDEARILQALRNLKAAIGALDRDPRQALRSMQAQTEDLYGIAQSKADPVFKGAVTSLAESITRKDIDSLNRPEVRRLAAPLLAFLPAEPARPAA